MQFAVIKKSVFLIFFICFVVRAQSQAPPPPVKEDPNTSAWKEPTPPSDTEWTIWKDEHFQISYPPKWYAQPLEEPNSLVGLFSAMEPNDNFKEFVIVYKTHVIFKGTTAELGQKMEQFIKEQHPKAKLVSSRVLKLNSFEATELTFAGSVGEGSKNR